MPIMLAITPRPSTMSTITEVKTKISKASLISASIAFPADGTQQHPSKNRTTVHRVMNTRCAWRQIRASNLVQPARVTGQSTAFEHLVHLFLSMPLNFEGGSKLRLQS